MKLAEPQTPQPQNSGGGGGGEVTPSSVDRHYSMLRVVRSPEINNLHSQKKKEDLCIIGIIGASGQTSPAQPSQPAADEPA